MKSLIRIFLLAACMLVSVLPAYAGDVLAHIDVVRAFFPDVSEIGQSSGTPPAAAVYKDKKIIGYVFFTDDITRMPAYSGKPISTLIGINAQGKIVGVKIIHHEEPILVTGISEKDMQAFTAQYLGFNVSDRVKIGGDEREGYRTIDGLSGATITAMVLNATINRSVREVAISRGLIEGIKVNGSETLQESLGETYPVWVYVWQNRIFQIVILCTGLFLLLVILVMQDWLVRHTAIFRKVRTGFLLFTTFFIGWYMLAQLSVLNVLTFINSFVHGFSWENFMIDPLMFILWGFVAMTLLLWGRGVYCGWLCPFGALQELLFRLGEMLRVRSFEFPDVVHERLWAIKYIILLGLFGLSMQSLLDAELAAEIEPFKTVFTLRFNREWGYLLYAFILLVMALFNRKFYCRYLCALGASLTFPAKFRIFDWLRRRKECGRPCQICEHECEVRAIRPTGEINANECHYCLDCQVTYWNAYKCPPLVDKRKRKERFSTQVSPAEK